MFSEDEMSTNEEASNEHHFPADCLGNEGHTNFFGESKILASLWAAVQTELLTYRRLREGDEWISQNFNMLTLYKGLTSRDKVDVALVQEEMMKPFCGCGHFPNAVPGCPFVEDAAACYPMDLNDADRANFISCPLWREDLWREDSW